MLIYLAGPLFSEAERLFNLELTQRLEAMVRVPLDYVVGDMELLLRVLAGQGSGAEEGTE